MKENKTKDQMFYQILSDLSEDIVNDTQIAADKTIDLSTQFLGDNGQAMVEDFRTLCASDESSKVSEQLKVVQQNMKQVAEKNAAIRAEVSVVLSAMQFSEFLRQHLTGLRCSFEAMINSETENISQIKLAMQKQMHTFDERKAFHEHVMHEQMPEQDQEVTQDLIDQLIG